jgi:fructokinase
MILSFGEVLMDCFPDRNVIGGAPFNVAVHLRRLGEEVGIVTKVGEDEIGLQIQSILTKERLTGQLQIDPNYPTGRVDVTLNQGQPSYFIHEGCGWEFIGVNEITAPDFFVFGSLALFFEKNKQSFKNYRDQFNDTAFICDLNLRVPFYDKDTLDMCLNAADILKINDEELSYLSNEYHVDDVINWLKIEFNIHKVLLTEGAKGATLFWDNQIISCPVKSVKNIKDTVGAGDSFTSLFLHGIIHELPLDHAMQRAADFAGAICQTSGAVPGDLSIYEKFKL